MLKGSKKLNRPAAIRQSGRRLPSRGSKIGSVEEFRQRIEKLTDAELPRYGRAARSMADHESQRTSAPSAKCT
jgi:hypothetical protein